MLHKAVTGIWNTWDIQWFYTIFKREGLVLYPYRSLTWNCGCGGGTHGEQALDKSVELGKREYYMHGCETLEAFAKKRLSNRFEFPKKIQQDEKAMRYLGLTFLEERIRQSATQPFHMRRIYLRIQWLYQSLRKLFARLVSCFSERCKFFD